MPALETDARKRSRRRFPGQRGGWESDGAAPWLPDIRRLDEKIDNRFFWLLGIFGAGVMALGGLTISSTNRLSDKLDATSGRHDANIQRLDAKLDATAKRLDAKLDATAERLSAKIDGVSVQVAGVAERVSKLEGAAETKPQPVVAPRR